MELDPPKVGGVVLFSAANMHSTIPKTSGYTRFEAIRTCEIEPRGKVCEGTHRRTDREACLVFGIIE